MFTDCQISCSLSNCRFSMPWGITTNFFSSVNGTTSQSALLQTWDVPVPVVVRGIMCSGSLSFPFPIWEHLRNTWMKFQYISTLWSQTCTLTLNVSGVPWGNVLEALDKYSCGQRFTSTHHVHGCHGPFSLLMIYFKCSFSWAEWLHSIHLWWKSKDKNWVKSIHMSLNINIHSLKYFNSCCRRF